MNAASARSKRRARSPRIVGMGSTTRYDRRPRAAFGAALRDGPRALPPEERPRELMATRGPGYLSDRELLSVVLNAGVRGRSVTELAQELADRLDGPVPGVDELAAIAGLGKAKACAVAAMLEYGKRRWGPHGARVGTPGEAFPLIRHLADRKQERFACLSLNGAHELIALRIVTIGLINRTIVHPREVYADPLCDRACAVIVAHNHPSGRLEPSDEDEDITLRLRQAGEILGIPLLDHIIFSEDGYFSFLQEGRLPQA